MAHSVTNSDFDLYVLKSDIPVLVDFWAPWCGPCKMIGPVIEEFSKEFEGKVRVAKVNVDEEQELAMNYGVSSIPTLVVFNNGKIVRQELGFRPKQALVEMVKGLI